MRVKRIILILTVFSCFQLGCAADPEFELELSSTAPLVSIDVDDAAKLDYLGNLKRSLKYYRQVAVDLKYYHDPHNFKELAQMIDAYVQTYIDDILVAADSSGNIDIELEIAKIHLVVTSLYFDIGYQIKAVKYLESFHQRYHDDTYLLEKSLNPADIGYASLAQGMKFLEQRAHRKILPVVHGKMYPWDKAHGKIYPWRNPDR
jgi:hypothetical protein